MSLATGVEIAPTTAHVRPRIQSVDVLRGLVMIFLWVFWALGVSMIVLAGLTYVSWTLAIVAGGIRYGRTDFLFRNPPALLGPTDGFPPDSGYNLAAVYLVWIAVVVMLYPACRWFAVLKQRNRSAVLGYL